MVKDEQKTCKACGHTGRGKYCSHCSQAYELRRITVKHLLLDAIQFFTNFDKGFTYTLKGLLTKPGSTQWEYIYKDRVHYQKPIPFMLICATIAAAVRYWIYSYTGQRFGDGVVTEAYFFREFWTLMHLGFMPLYILVAYLFFFRSKYNYAEVGVLMVYLFSIIFLIAAILSLSKLIWPDIDTAWLELLVFALLVPLHFLGFFKEEKRWMTIIKSLLILFLLVLFIQNMEDQALWLLNWQQ